MFVCCECCVLSGRGLCNELITRPEESYRMWCVVCDLETSSMRRPWPALGRSAAGGKNYEISICGMGSELSQFYKIPANNYVQKYYMRRIMMVITFIYIIWNIIIIIVYFKIWAYPSAQLSYWMGSSLPPSFHLPWMSWQSVHSSWLSYRNIRILANCASVTATDMKQ
jgi:hypothetical protein